MSKEADSIIRSLHDFIHILPIPEDEDFGIIPRRLPALCGLTRTWLPDFPRAGAPETHWEYFGRTPYTSLDLEHTIQGMEGCPNCLATQMEK